MIKARRHNRQLAILLGAVLLLPALSDAGSPTDPKRLLKKYHAIAEQLQHNVYGHPIYIESEEKSAQMRGEIWLP